MYRLYVDEVGTDGVTHVENEKHRYLSLTGIAMSVIHARDYLSKNLDWIKLRVFDPDPDEPPIILHRRDIVAQKGPFGVLKNAEKHELFNKAILRLIEGAEYTVITGMVDKAALLKKHHWQNRHPYHLLMEILVEKFVQFLERKGSIGDIMPESRGAKDQLLQNAYDDVRKRGTAYVSHARIAQALRGSKLKFRTKPDNIAGLQLCDLVAHPSHMNLRRLKGHEVRADTFGSDVAAILTASKYDRSPGARKIMGYGMKYLP